MELHFLVPHVYTAHYTAQSIKFYVKVVYPFTPGWMGSGVDVDHTCDADYGLVAIKEHQ